MGAAVVYFYLAAILSLVAVADSVDKAVVPGDRVGLDAIFDATDGQHWRNNTGWLSDSCWCTWYGVTCYNGTLGACASVYAIDLSSNGLRGSIPDKIGAIQLMVSLNMTNNTLSSTLPAALFKLPRLQYLNIGLGQLTGTIPTAVSQCTTLRELSLYTHQLSGTVPSLSELGELRILDLYGNKLSGPLPSVSSAVDRNHLAGVVSLDGGLVPHLRQLILSRNRLEVANLTNHFSSLEILDLSYNFLTRFPSLLEHQQHLSELRLRNNLIDEELPFRLLLQTQLAVLDLSNNLLRGSPNPVFYMKSPATGYLFWKHLYQEMPLLRELFLANNPFTDNLETNWSFNALPRLVFLDLSNTRARGQFDPRLLTYPSLRTLILSNNDYDPFIPALPPGQYVSPSLQLVDMFNFSTGRITTLEGSIFQASNHPITLEHYVSLSPLKLQDTEVLGFVGPKLNPTAKCPPGYFGVVDDCKPCISEPPGVANCSSGGTFITWKPGFFPICSWNGTDRSCDNSVNETCCNMPGAVLKGFEHCGPENEERCLGGPLCGFDVTQGIVGCNSPDDGRSSPPAMPCHHGYFGRLCAACTAGHGHSQRGQECTKCARGLWAWVGLAVLLLFLFVSPGLAILMKREACLQNNRLRCILVLLQTFLDMCSVAALCFFTLFPLWACVLALLLGTLRVILFRCNIDPQDSAQASFTQTTSFFWNATFAIARMYSLERMIGVNFGFSYGVQCLFHTTLESDYLVLLEYLAVVLLPVFYTLASIAWALGLCYCCPTPDKSWEEGKRDYLLAYVMFFHIVSLSVGNFSFRKDPVLGIGYSSQYPTLTSWGSVLLGPQVAVLIPIVYYLLLAIRLKFRSATFESIRSVIVCYDTNHLWIWIILHFVKLSTVAVVTTLVPLRYATPCLMVILLLSLVIAGMIQPREVTAVLDDQDLEPDERETEFQRKMPATLFNLAECVSLCGILLFMHLKQLQLGSEADHEFYGWIAFLLRIAVTVVFCVVFGIAATNLPLLLLRSIKSVPSAVDKCFGCGSWSTANGGASTEDTPTEHTSCNIQQYR